MAGVVQAVLYEPTERQNVFKPHRTRCRVESGSAGESTFEGVEQPVATYVLTLNGWRGRVRRGWYALWNGILLRVAAVVPNENWRETSLYAEEHLQSVLVEEPLTVGGEPITVQGEPLTVVRRAGADG